MKTEKKKDNFTKNYILFHRLYIALFFVLVIVLELFLNKEFSIRSIVLCTLLLIFLILDELLLVLNLFDIASAINRIRFFQFIFLFAVIIFYNYGIYIFGCSLVLLINYGVEYISKGHENEYHDLSIRKLILGAVALVIVFLNFTNYTEAIWFSLVLVSLVMIFSIFIIVDNIYISSKKLFDSVNDLFYENNRILQHNDELIKYQEKVKTVNEQINYQKIELRKVVNDLEMANLEITSQSDIMKYMVSNFDVLKCANVIAEAISNVKKPSVCAIYIKENVYLNKQPSCIIKTNYISMERRLKKDISNIYNENSLLSEPIIIKGKEMKKYRFLGETNIASIAIFSIAEGKKSFGMLLLCSEEEEFFSGNLNYYETTIAEFKMSIRSSKMYLKMQDMAIKDGLTKIYNRVHFQELLDKESKLAIRYKSDLTVALLDIDNFKRVNDTYGHIAGDEVIKMVARLCKDEVENHGGFASRYGGEEFVLVLPKIKVENALSIMESLHNKIINTTVKFNDNLILTNSCIGITSYPAICDDVNLLVGRADAAMYYGKKHGRGRIIIDGQYNNTQGE